VQRTLPDDILLQEARTLARAMAEIRPDVAAAAKRALRYGALAGMADAMKNEQAVSGELRKNRKS
jgi:enoyl-CoA hydratase/carnithine racemase